MFHLDNFWQHKSKRRLRPSPPPPTAHGRSALRRSRSVRGHVIRPPRHAGQGPGARGEKECREIEKKAQNATTAESRSQRVIEFPNECHAIHPLRCSLFDATSVRPRLRFHALPIFEHTKEEAEQRRWRARAGLAVAAAAEEAISSSGTKTE